MFMQARYGPMPKVFTVMSWYCIVVTWFNFTCFICCRFGVIAEPEFSEWIHLTVEHSYLVITSDGIFERMKLQDVCNLFHQNVFLNLTRDGEKLGSQILADAIVDSALKSGSFDNLAALVYPLEFSGKRCSISYGTETKIVFLDHVLSFVVNF